MGKEKMYYEQLGYDPDPPFYAPISKPIVTNYDRIISKTPEELAEWLYIMRSRLTCIPDIQIEKCAKKTDCKKCYLEWVKMEGEAKCSTDTDESQKAGVSTAQQRQR